MPTTLTYTNPPTKCDICKAPINTTFYDGRTVEGPWANMCPICFKRFGVGLGTGKGQRYVKGPEGRFYRSTP